MSDAKDRLEQLVREQEAAKSRMLEAELELERIKENGKNK